MSVLPVFADKTSLHLCFELVNSGDKAVLCLNWKAPFVEGKGITLLTKETPGFVCADFDALTVLKVVLIKVVLVYVVFN